MSKKKKIFDIIQIGDKSNFASRCFDIFLVVVILSNITVLLLETFEELRPYFTFFRYVEYITTAIFLIEYILRIWTANYLYPNEKPGKARLHFLLSYDGIVDLLTIIPAFFLTGFIAFRMLRVVRIFHLFRLNAQYDSFNVITSVIKERRNQLFSSLFIILILMLSSSLCMYSAEHAAQPEVFKNAFSGIWWAVSTILTVGYGDITPITVLGKVMAIVIAFLGVGVVAIPTGIISAGFVEQYTKNQSLSDSNVNSSKNLKNISIIEIKVDKKFKGKKLQAIKESQNIDIYLVIRDDLQILPYDELVLKSDDILITKAK